MRKLFTLTIFILLCSITVAQTTTSSIAGKITDSQNRPLLGATIAATHLPTQTQYHSVANSEGYYHLYGLKAGGPYTVTVSFIGYKSANTKDIHLILGETKTINAQLKTELTIIDDVIVIGGIDRSASDFSTYQIETTPTVSRSIYDIARLSPYAIEQQEGGISIAGTNSRYNAFYIDGIVNNDIYGLTSSGTNGGLAGANPIPLDALEQIQIVTTPFDIRQSGFTGGAINAVTKSGTNEGFGTAYAYYNNNKFYGSGIDRTPLSKQSTIIYGASIGGAIVKNRLFFFVNAESSSDHSPSAYHIGDPKCKVSENDAITISNHYKELTGYNGGGYGRKSIDRTSNSILARLDWNISDKHKFDIRYNFLDAKKDEHINSAATLLFHGSGYTSTSTTHSVTAELNSRISPSVHNSLRVGYTRVIDGRDTESKTPFVIIDRIRDGENTAVKIGTDGMAGANALTQNSITITDYVLIDKENHNITIGTHNELFAADVLFLANALGSYTYNSMDDFLADKPSMFQQSLPIGDASTKISTAQFGLFIQDETWLGDLQLTYGLRADIPVIFNTPKENKEFNASAIAQKYEVQTNSKPRTNVLFSPRIGFKWDIPGGSEPEQMELRGGVGIFTGRIPFVWITNCYSNTGMTQNSYTLYGNDIPSFGVEPSGSAGISANPTIYVSDRKFRYPQSLKANLAFDYHHKGWNFTVEGIFGKTFNDMLIRNLIAEDSGAKLYAVSKEAATKNNTSIYYNSSNKKQFSSIYYLENDSSGYNYSLSAMLDRSFTFGLSLSASYTFSRAYSVNDGVSSSAPSIWGKSYATDSNNKKLSISVFDTPHKINLSARYTTYYGKIFGTTIALIYQGYSGMRYSLTYYKNSIDVNGDTYRGNSTLYIPTEEELAIMDFENEQQKAQFNNYIENNRYLRTHRGQYSERNAFNAPFEHHLDLHIAEDILFRSSGMPNGSKVQITLDIMNFGNLLCRKWGSYYFLDDWKLSPVEVISLTDDGNGNKIPKYRFVGGEISRNDLLSRWHMQLGMRIVF